MTLLIAPSLTVSSSHISNASLLVFLRGLLACFGDLEILSLRKAIWGKIPQRDHRAHKVFPFGDSGDELMVYGTVDYNHHDGAQKGTEWAARIKLVKEEGKVKMALYHVFLVRNSPYCI